MRTESRSGSRHLLAAALADVRRCAAGTSDALLHHVPDTGDHVTGRIVDDFVDQASDALRALAESVADALASLESPESLESLESLDPGAGPGRGRRDGR
ncbi:hypothetical protein [Lapillicoccus sp.]|uniref:hypothetical protein n=1 Tax=Lapillicoccus sp. TaxID=1909287 RepID=UPI0026000417|nr:hypothetical protein [Lapillicoccus sp.]